jgi:hypothetical protein
MTMDQTQLRTQSAGVSAAVDIFVSLRKHFERLDGNALWCYVVLWDLAGSRPGSLEALEFSQLCVTLKRRPRTIEDTFEVLAGYRLLELGKRSGDVWPIRVISWREAVRAYHLNEAPRDEPDPQRALFETVEPPVIPDSDEAEPPRLFSFPAPAESVVVEHRGEYRAELPNSAGNTARYSPGSSARYSPSVPVEEMSIGERDATRLMLGDLKALCRGKITREEALARGSLSLDFKLKPSLVFDSQESNTRSSLRLDRPPPGNTARPSAAVDRPVATAASLDPTSIAAEICAACPSINGGLARRAAAAVVAKQISIEWLRDLLRRLPADCPWKYFKGALTSQIGQQARSPPSGR